MQRALARGRRFWGQTALKRCLSSLVASGGFFLSSYHLPQTTGIRLRNARDIICEDDYSLARPYPRMYNSWHLDRRGRRGSCGLSGAITELPFSDPEATTIGRPEGPSRAKRSMGAAELRMHR